MSQRADFFLLFEQSEELFVGMYRRFYKTDSYAEKLLDLFCFNAFH